jgi:UDP-N-acetyl-D-mannosaminuronate dehydrogenase
LEVHNKIPKDCGASVYIITVGTPLNAEKQIDLKSIQSVCHEIALHLKMAISSSYARL